MWRIAVLLIFTLLIVPVVTFYYDEPLSELQRDTINMLALVYVITSALAFITSTITKNYSQVDKLWSTIPVLYVWIAAHYGGYAPRLVLMASLVTIWGIRLTYNFGRRGGYSWKFWSGEEDYRWSVLQSKTGFQKRWKWTLFNLFFISYYQMGLILIMTLPIVKVMGVDSPLNWLDFLIALAFVGFVFIEFIADQQQYEFQQEKWRMKNGGIPLKGKYKLGFAHTGLWAYMRHPNYMAEQAVWIVFYLFSVAVTGNWINWSIAGCLLLVLLFKGSSDFSESITSEKYPAYQKYQKEVGRFLPIKGKFKA